MFEISKNACCFLKLKLCIQCLLLFDQQSETNDFQSTNLNNTGNRKLFSRTNRCWH